MRNSAIAIFAYKRPDCLRNLLQSLQRNNGIENLEIYVFVDGPKSPAEIDLVNEVQSVALDFSLQLEMHLKVSPINLGLANSVKTNISLLFESYESLIVLEDDLVLSKFFLEFMLEGLQKFAEDAKIAGISGYSYPINNPSQHGYLLPGGDCWGWATWRDRWQQIEWDPNSLISSLRSNGKVNSFNLGGAYDYYGMLVDSRLGLIDSWAIYWHASMFLSGKYTYYPSKTLVLNFGMDGSGTHFNSKSKVFDMRSEPTDSFVAIQTDQLQILSAELASLYRSNSNSKFWVSVYKAYRKFRRLGSMIFKNHFFERI
jgi:hypothetical protein